MHTDEVHVPADLVRRLLERRFPQWAQLPLVELPSYDTDARLYRLGAELLVRLPKIHWAAGQIPFERQLLPRLAPRLPVAIPEIVALAKPSPTPTATISPRQRQHITPSMFEAGSGHLSPKYVPSRVNDPGKVGGSVLDADPRINGSS